MVKSFVWRILDFIIAAIFIYAGVLKALDPVQLAHDIDHYKTLPWAVGVGLAFYLPWLEIFCSLALIFRLFYRGALAILTALVVVFLVATIAAKVRGLDITCGCFGHASQNWSFPTHLALDLAILVALAALCYCSVARARANASPMPTS
jgi:putative oxidoreductase